MIHLTQWTKIHKNLYQDSDIINPTLGHRWTWHFSCVSIRTQQHTPKRANEFITSNLVASMMWQENFLHNRVIFIIHSENTIFVKPTTLSSFLRLSRSKYNSIILIVTFNMYNTSIFHFKHWCYISDYLLMGLCFFSILTLCNVHIRKLNTEEKSFSNNPVSVYFVLFWLQ